MGLKAGALLSPGDGAVLAVLAFLPKLILNRKNGRIMKYLVELVFLE